MGRSIYPMPITSRRALALWMDVHFATLPDHRVPAKGSQPKSRKWPIKQQRGKRALHRTTRQVHGSQYSLLHLQSTVDARRHSVRFPVSPSPSPNLRCKSPTDLFGPDWRWVRALLASSDTIEICQGSGVRYYLDFTSTARMLLYDGSMVRSRKIIQRISTHPNSPKVWSTRGIITNGR
ncbi:hypothetical protein B0T21DRAFT_344182 [Apiosordaria backusii]|uniref:Uncharacterized protein n=1 Tax=Apiosordaria backusii TaxID=314023 RepID=A0AA40EZQ4_9PEZI|nr:hypothetical protein B0T21DRAFT_344182 [Apiosordaria backusii]